MDNVTLDGFGPYPLRRPASVDQLGHFVREAAAAQQAIYPVGGLTQIAMGNPPARPGVAIDLRGLDQVIDFPARDMTITLQAGMSLKRLCDLTAAENLRLPIDVPDADHATLGGTLAANVSGSRRFGFGTLRDYVIGIAAINDEGRVFHAGGRVVKNVAGYDLCKLLVGSLGTLGIISQVTLKLRPLPEEQAIVCMSCPAAHHAVLLDKLMASRTRPVILDTLNRAGCQALAGVATPPDADWVVLAGYEGNRDAVNWQLQQLVKEVCPQVRMDARVGSPAGKLAAALTEWPAWASAKATFKASVPSSVVPEMLRRLEALGEGPALRAHAGNGIVVGHYARDLEMGHALELLKAWREHAGAFQGTVTVARCPAVWKKELNVWGPAPKDAELMRRVRAEFDPRHLFNPGRFLV